MKLINKLERKFDRYAIHNLMYYIIVLQVVGIFLGQINQTFVVDYLSLDINKVFQGQIWRLVTFIMTGYVAQDMSNFMNLIFVAIELYLYYYLGRTLENAWGTFRFNLYYISGILFNILAAIFVFTVLKFAYPYDLSGYSYLFGIYGLTYVNRSLFFAFATVFPDMELLYMFIIPLKVKYLGYLYGAIMAIDVFNCFKDGSAFGWIQAVVIIIAIANYIIFFFTTRNYRKGSVRQRRRKMTYTKKVSPKHTDGPRHRCTVCGRTELNDPNLEFRYCSRCDGNYEYCMEHLFTHEHVKKH